jgi:hypothetical protein
VRFNGDCSIQLPGIVGLGEQWGTAAAEHPHHPFLPIRVDHPLLKAVAVKLRYACQEVPEKQEAITR